MSFIKNCFNCHSSLTEFTPLYYCCNNIRPLCNRCKPLRCQICKKNDWKEIKEKQCLICKRKLNQDEGLKEQLCGQHYCPRCLAHIFLPYYLSKDPPIIIEMRCGHFKDKIEIEAALADYCINCGYKFREVSDFSLQNDMKLCSYCFNCDGRLFEQFLQRCLNCGKILKAKEGVLCFDLLLCKPCSQSQSLIEQSIVQSHINETKSHSMISQLKSEKIPLHRNHQDDEQPLEQLSIVSRFSAFQIEEEEKKKKKNRISSIRMLSKNSVEIRVQNFKLPSIVIDKSIKLINCQLCNILLTEEGTLPNTTYSKSRICKMCYAQTFDKSYISYTRYNNYLPNDQRSTSLAKNQQVNHNPMKMSMLPPQPVSTIRESQPSKILQYPMASKVQKKQAWQLESAIRNPCDLCSLKTSMIIRPDKKKVCVDCHNKKR